MPGSQMSASRLRCEVQRQLPAYGHHRLAIAITNLIKLQVPEVFYYAQKAFTPQLLYLIKRRNL
jgi:hypothetical protein